VPVAAEVVVAEAAQPEVVAALPAGAAAMAAHSAQDRGCSAAAHSDRADQAKLQLPPEALSLLAQQQAASAAPSALRFARALAA